VCLSAPIRRLAIEEDEMPVIGVHALVYSREAEGLRQVFSEAFAWSHVDAGGGWPIYALPAAELGVHPSDQPRYELSLVCDEIGETVSELCARGVEFRGEPAERGWGTAVTMILPGGVEMLLYQPHHPTALET
jgi:hypothetical protein